jgi:DNA repair photolyase
MKLTIAGKNVKTALSKTNIPGRKYCLNPYTGCEHACTYCYATFMKRFSGHREPWGRFVDIKLNAPLVLQRQLRHAEKGPVLLSSVTDPYQPIEKKHMITRKCLEVLAFYQFPVDILTKSPLVGRDIDIIAQCKDAEVGFSITTDNERVRKIFEPQAPPFQARIEALKKLKRAGIKTYVFIGPILPMNIDKLSRAIEPFADSILIDRLNYAYKVTRIYEKYRLDKWLKEEYINDIITYFKKKFAGKLIVVC